MFTVLFSSPIEMAEGLPKQRRPSLGTLQATKSKNIMQPTFREDGYVEMEYIFNMANNIIGLHEEDVSNRDMYAIIDRDLSGPFQMKVDDFECVGIIALFVFDKSKKGHFVPYVRVGDTWYNGDSEVGFLRRRSEPPSIFMEWSNPDIEPGTTIITDAVLFYVKSSLIHGGRGDQNGTLVFGQTDYTCGPDSLQTVLMFADGFYEYFNEGLYSQLKKEGHFPSRRPKNMAELKGNIQAFDKKKYVSLLSKRNIKQGKRGSILFPVERASILFLLLMFNRYSYIENITEKAGEHFELVPNTSIANKKLRDCYYIGQGDSPIYEEVFFNGDDAVDIIETLLQCGKNPNKGDYGHTPLFRAVLNGYNRVVELLLRYKDADPATPTPRPALDIEAGSTVVNVGRSPLGVACNNKNIENVKMLCEAGADVNKEDVLGITPLILVCKMDTQYNEFTIPIATILLEHGADITKTDNTGKSALAYAGARGNSEIVELLSSQKGGRRTRRRTRRHRPKRRL